MNTQAPMTLLGQLSPADFMQQYWQRQPLVIRQAIPGFQPLLSREQLAALASQDEVESRLIGDFPDGGWQMERGPFEAEELPGHDEPKWTLLVQGVDLHDARVHALMQQFRFIPDARLDDVMISYATEGGGVGPHFDSYDVFLLQAMGKRRWRIGRQQDRTLLPDLPVRILADFQPEEEFVLEPGDMLYLPPGWAHDGVAVEGECMTYSIGFRVPQRGDLARELLGRMADPAADPLGEALYEDADQPAVQASAAIPVSMQDFARQAIAEALQDDDNLACALGEYLTEPKANVWFDVPEQQPEALQACYWLDRRTRMLYDEQHVFINGESYRAAGEDAALMRQLANQRQLDADTLAAASEDARALLLSWADDGWGHTGAALPQ